MRHLILWMTAAGCGNEPEAVEVSSEDTADEVVEQTYIQTVPTSCGLLGAILPGNADENDQWAAVRYPAEGPFVATSVSYTTWLDSINEWQCGPVPHEVWLVFGGESPDPDPEPAQVHMVTDFSNTLGAWEAQIDLTLDTPIEVGEGEHLYLMVQFPYSWHTEPYDRLCVTSCYDEALVEEGTTWWTDEPQAPLAWRLTHAVLMSTLTGVQQ